MLATCGHIANKLESSISENYQTEFSFHTQNPIKCVPHRPIVRSENLESYSVIQTKIYLFEKDFCIQSIFNHGK